VGEAAVQTDELSSSVAEEAARLSSVEQALYMNRVAKLMHKVDYSKQQQQHKTSQHQKQDHSSKDTTGEAPGEAVVKVDDVDTIELRVDKDEQDNKKVFSDVELMVKGRKKKRKAAQLAAEEGEFIPLDPTNWRAKTF
jgi:hypothetical protein